MANPDSSKTVNPPVAQVVADVPALTSDMQRMLAGKGINVSAITAPTVVYHTKVSWEELCQVPTTDPKTWSSPVLCVTSVQSDPMAPKEFKDYRGLVIVQFTTEFGYDQFVTHALTYEDSGEYLPLTAWLLQNNPPFLARFGRIATNKPNQHIIRPLPLDIAAG